MGSSTIERQFGTKFPLNNPEVYEGKAMGTFYGAISAYVMVIAYFGPERFHQNLNSYDSEDCTKEIYYYW